LVTHVAATVLVQEFQPLLPSFPRRFQDSVIADAGSSFSGRFTVRSFRRHKDFLENAWPQPSGCETRRLIPQFESVPLEAYRYSSMSYAFFSHRFTSASISSTLVIGIRCVIRSFLAKPPVSMSLPVAFVSLSAKPKSIRVFVVGLICAKT